MQQQVYDPMECSYYVVDEILLTLYVWLSFPAYFYSGKGVAPSSPVVHLKNFCARKSTCPLLVIEHDYFAYSIYSFTRESEKIKVIFCSSAVNDGA